MHCEIEISSLDLRYEDRRVRNRSQERRLLSSIVERGIEDPLQGVEFDGVHVLLNGFKRYRCARKLKIELVPYVSLGTDTAAGIVALLRTSKAKSLTLLEQAGFIDELRRQESLCVAEIAELLSRSKSWVSMRIGLMDELSEPLRRAMFSGGFPVYSYMYTLRQFMRMNSVRKQDIEAFVLAVSGKGLSTREIEGLAHGCFRGPDTFREQVLSGNLAVPLEQMRQIPEQPDGCNAFERGLLKDLELVGKYMQRVIGKSHDPRLKTGAFHAQANLLTAGILSRSPGFTQAMRQLHDRSAQA